MVSLVDAADEMGRFALDRGLIDPINFKLAETRSRETGMNLYDSLVSENFIDDSVIKESLSTYLDLPLAPLEFIVDPFRYFADVIPRNYVIENRITDPADLNGFNLDGYQYFAADSKPGKPVFRRKEKK